MPILVCALRAEAWPAQLRYAPLFPVRALRKPARQVNGVGWVSRRRHPTFCYAALSPFTLGFSTLFAAVSYARVYYLPTRKSDGPFLLVVILFVIRRTVLYLR